MPHYFVCGTRPKGFYKKVRCLLPTGVLNEQRVHVHDARRIGEQTVVQEACVQTEVNLLGGLPGQVRISKTGDKGGCRGLIGEEVVTTHANG